jgi:hypothetical protein
VWLGGDFDGQSLGVPANELALNDVPPSPHWLAATFAMPRPSLERLRSRTVSYNSKPANPGGY